ncbi:hypothetical protein BGZ68_006950 [Mortierella alpina]|nr:hypothetical protein BGZ68_006950 [Mortierella alpina]
MRLSFVLSTVIALLVSSLVHSSQAQKLCNGYAELCARPYNKVAFATTHNAFASSAGALGANQNHAISVQLKDGIRALMLDSYNPLTGNTGDIQLCHTACTLLDGGSLSKALEQIKTFLENNPNEVITIFFENAGNLAASQFQTVYTAVGMDKYAFTQPAASGNWPTLGEMIATGKRLVSFIDSGADPNVPWLMSEYDYIFETPYSILRDTPYPCTIDRPKDQRRQLYVLNHFVSGTLNLNGQAIDVPEPGLANVTNTIDLTNHINSCQTAFLQIPNFIAVDFYEKGSILQATAAVNGVTWNGKEPTPAQYVSSTNTTSAAYTLSTANARLAGVVSSVMALAHLALY